MDLITAQSQADGSVTLNLRNQNLFTAIRPGAPDAPFSPVELMVSSLGACLAIMVNDYCRSHGYHNGQVTICLTQQLGSDPKRITAITVDVELPQDFPVHKHDVIRRLIEHCPVHQTLQNPPVIDVEIV